MEIRSGSPLVVLIVATLFATLGLTSLAAMQDRAPLAVAAPISQPSSLASETQREPAAPLQPETSPIVPLPAAINLSYLNGPSSVNPNEIPEDNRKKPLKFTLDEELGTNKAGTLADNDEKEGTDAQKKTPRAPSVSIYEVTAYYLNVRANPYNGSKVLRVVERGTRLEVAAVTEKGWLRLNDGGYVHGGYASLIDPDEAVGRTPGDGLPVPQTETATSAKERQVEPKGAVAAEPDGVKQAPSDPSSPTNRVRSDSGLTEEHIAKLFSGTALAGHGIEDVVLEIEDEYGINALFTIAVMKLESGNGKSKLSRTKNNLFGLNATSGDANNKAFSFKTKADSVRKFGQLLADKYVDKGFTTIDKVASKYCPASSSWAGKVKGIMKSDYRKL
ncbi:glucosaminidase domain-containing protein [Cohnella ginsengisoli]|uniref:Glucosaminidase domain-containing protein n=1 Tax=Cohnella ginsengisoli TaxID=425004 RepID=A0A9X4KL17_9BACL|nr:glucosaminidase domain-containing protein [Cohnella ginsengisoli]MDG0793711.1 glucosaminidase domain-containing protein [Cohnella ginsengisoli]